MIPLKHNYSFIIGDAKCSVHSDEKATGAFYFDTRMLSQYEWDFSQFKLLQQISQGSSMLTQYWSCFEDHKQTLLIERIITLHDRGFSDRLIVHNDDIDAHTFTARLQMDSDFVDMFEVRNQRMQPIKRNIETQRSTSEYHAEYIAQDDKKFTVHVAINGVEFDSNVTVAAREQKVIAVEVQYVSDIDDRMLPLPAYQPWLGQGKINDQHGVFAQAEHDLHDLLLATPQGLTIAAGIPWFVTPFGRDSLITAWFLLQPAPQLAEGVLRYLALHQGQQNDPFRDEEPGKIMHELRHGEASRLDILPFKTYYGTADATPLFLMLLGDYCKRTGSYDLANELSEHWQAALGWLNNFSDERGLIVFRANHAGLIVQSWKDSNDSLSYADGRLGQGALAVAEVQGYAYAAYLAAAELYEQQGNSEQAEITRNRAHALQHGFLELFWMPHKNNFAIAVDEQNQPLDIDSSDTGHLLWSGIVPNDYAKTVVKRLFEPDLWSGWGLRTLSTREVRYNPLSYHNGSVWPHDTGIFAAGLHRYGFHEECKTVCNALEQLAATQADKRLPELLAGYAKDSHPVLPYIEACRPQAWSAAALVYAMAVRETL